MRKIKFRGKNLSDDWVYGDLIHFRGNTQIAYLEPGSRRKYEVMTNPIDPETVGEYTGFDDADGTEIYEGDRLVSVEASKKAKRRGEINVVYKVVLNEEYHTWDMEYENGKGVQTIQLDVYRAKKYRVMKEAK